MLRAGAEVLSTKSNVETVCVTFMSSFRRALMFLSASTVALLARPAAVVREAEVLALLVAILSDVEAGIPNGDRDRSYSLASAIRGVLELCPDPLHDGSSLAAAIQKYRPNLRRPNRPRTNDLPTALAHLPHVDWDDLRQQTHALVKKQRADVVTAASHEIDQYEELVRQQTEWLGLAVPIKTQKLVMRWLGTGPRARKHLDLPSVPVHEIAAVLLQMQSADAGALDSNGWPKWDLGTPEVLTTLKGLKEYRYKGSSAPWSQARHRLPNPVLTAIFLLILNHTGWNQGAVGALMADGVKVMPEGGYRLQSYKGKTDDDTPIVDIPASARLICKAIHLLLWNRQQLQGFGLIPQTEERIWFGWQADGFSHISNFSAAYRVKNFCNRHGISVFTPSELRPLAAAETYLTQRDLEAVRVLLGHKDLTVTDGYLQNTLFFRMNEANMLQFQRRVETSLVFASGGSKQVKERRLDPRDIDPKLLIPTGDGGACAAPLAGHPSQRLSPGEPCAGLMCQQGEGCPNYRLRVDELTIEMALRTLRYYRSRWTQLAHANLTGFGRLHIPRILFIHVLLSVVHSLRPDMLRKAQGALT